MMNRNTVYRFLRPTLFVLFCFLLSIFGAYLLSKLRNSEVTQDTTTLAVQEGTFRLPVPSLTAEEVVLIQLDGLASERNAHGILQCMAFASPDNLAVTGPMERFGRMVRTEKFRALAAPEQILIGKATIVENNARVLVTLLKDRKVWSYIWVLSKQRESPHEACWMTDGVFPLNTWDGSSPSVPSTEII